MLLQFFLFFRICFTLLYIVVIQQTKWSGVKTLDPFVRNINCNIDWIQCELWYTPFLFLISCKAETAMTMKIARLSVVQSPHQAVGTLVSSVIPPLRWQNPPFVCIQFLKQAEDEKVEQTVALVLTLIYNLLHDFECELAKLAYLTVYTFNPGLLRLVR